MAATVAGILLTGNHASRPSSGVSVGTLYSCTTHSLVYQTTDTGSTWVTWANLAGTGTTTTVATDTIWAAAGDLVQATGNDAAAVLSAGTAGYFLKAGGAGTASAWAARELDYVQYTAGTVSVTATAEGSANTLVTGSAIAYDGSTAIMVEFFCGRVAPNTGTANDFTVVYLYDGASSLGIMALEQTPAANSAGRSVFAQRRITPSAATHTYSIRATTNAGTASYYNGAGGSGNHPPMFIRITRAV